MTQQYRLLLASASPRRRELLAQANYIFDVIPSLKEEVITQAIPYEIVMQLAQQKAYDIFQNELIKVTSTSDSLPPLLVIGADTIVAYNNQILGKPVDAAEACNMLHMLSGNTHQVYTGVSLFYHDFHTDVTKQHCFYEKTDVTFYEMTQEEITAYVATGDCLDKAGAYGIQGPFAVHVKGICGDYNNVVGLPLARLYHEINTIIQN
jgi:septum formation protein